MCVVADAVLTIAVLMGFANWIATTIVVESELTRPLRERLDVLGAWEIFDDGTEVNHWAWNKVRYLVQCHLCTGTWVALAEACFVTLGLSSGLAGIVLSALVFKGMGHAILEVTAWLKRH